jgi:hypothetical protein
MPEIKMNMPEPPEGYEYTGEFRYPRDGELYYERDMYDGEHVAQKDMSTEYPILRKVHREPELVYCLQTHQSNWTKVGAPAVTPVKRLGTYAYTYGDVEFDLILGGDMDGEDSVWLGQWNDGPKCDHKTETDTGTIIQKQGICRECGQLV